MTRSAPSGALASDFPALLAEFTAWQTLLDEPAAGVDWLDDELDTPPTRGEWRVMPAPA
jgi:hypothetical protein